MNTYKTTIEKLRNYYGALIKDNMELNKEAWQEARAYIKSSTAYNHGEAVDFLYMPKIYPPDVVEYLAKVGEDTYNILCKIIKAYRADKDYRSLFSFPKEMEQWLTSPEQYPCLLPMLRADIFLNEDDLSFAFCEFNADGASAMNRDREIYNALQDTPPFIAMEKTWSLKSFELIRSWVRAFLDNCQATKEAGTPFVVIADFLESGTSEEFKVFCQAFNGAGVDCEIWEIRDLRRRNRGLYTPKGRKIDAIYRRAVTGELYNKRDETPDFIEAVKRGEVVTIGPLSTQVIHNKIIFEIAAREETLSFLTKEERAFVRAHFPATMKLNSQAPLAELESRQEQWLIKPGDLYGSRGVYAGKDITASQWRRLLRENMNTDYLVQRYQTPYITENFDFSQSSPVRQYNNITGLYIYNGKLAGFLARGGQQGVISSLHGGRTMTTVQAVPLL